jgi:hypothetical protein
MSSERANLFRMPSDSLLVVLRRGLLRRRTGWWLAAALTVFGLLLGPERLAQAGPTLAAAVREVVAASWFLLLLAGFGLTLGLARVSWLAAGLAGGGA